ncbi:MAG TPA: hypothetical protein DIU49_03875 [Desulfovibrio sp.]|nr:hypothetical protein [Desulfovibrio sp.]
MEADQTTSPAIFFSSRTSFPSRTYEAASFLNEKRLPGSSTRRHHARHTIRTVDGPRTGTNAALAALRPAEPLAQGTRFAPPYIYLYLYIKSARTFPRPETGREKSVIIHKNLANALSKSHKWCSPSFREKKKSLSQASCVCFARLPDARSRKAKPSWCAPHQVIARRHRRKTAVFPEFHLPAQEYPVLGYSATQPISTLVKPYNYERRAERLRALLVELRKNAGLRQTELAARLGCPQSFVSKYESGQRRLDLIELEAICKALGVTLAEFVAWFARQ